MKYLPQMADETSRRYIFVAIDRATCWGEGHIGIDPVDQFSPERAESPGFIRVCRARTAASARSFLRDLERVYPLRIHTILAHSGK